MPMPDREHYLFVNADMQQAYSSVSLKHFNVGRTVEEIRGKDPVELAPVLGDFFRAGALFLATHGGDDYLQEIGTVMHNVIDASIDLTVLKPGPLTGYVREPIELARTALSDQPQIRFNKIPTSFGFSTHIAIPPEFLITARERPIDALAATAWVGSLVRDFANKRYDESPYLYKRAAASEAQFLLSVPTSAQSFSSISQRTLDAYPHGMGSLPQEARYRGITNKAYHS